MSPRRRNASSWLQIPLIFTFYICLQVIQVAYARPTNITVEDDDPSIRYSPLAAWEWSWDELPTPPSSFEGGREKAVGRVKREPQYPSVEYDRIGGGTDTSSDPDLSSAVDTNLSPPLPVPKTQRRRTLSSQGLPRIGGEGQSPPQLPQEIPPATLQFDFTGSAIYLFAYSPLPPFFILTIDGQLQSLPTPYSDHPPCSSLDDAGAPYSSRLFYSNRTLNEGPHSVTLTFPALPGRDVAFAFDRIVYTQDVTLNPGSSAPSVPTPTSKYLRRQEPSSASSSGTTTESVSPTSTPPAPSDPSKKRNIATFAAAVGGSVGLLALFSAGLALSIIRRRYRAKRREREDRERRPEFPDPLDPSSSQDVRRTVRRAQVFGDEGIFGGRTRRGAQGRDMEERRGGSFSSDSSFVPRFFPGTEVPPPAQAATLTTSAQGRRGSGRSGSLDEPPPPMYNDALEAPVVPPPGLVTHHPYIHRPVDRRASLDSNEELGLPIGGREGGRVMGREDLSYADIPPSDPPPPEVVAASVGAPPSFPEAMASASSLPVPPLPVHQARSTRSFSSMHSNGQAHHQGGVQSQRRPEAAPLLHPASTSRPASASSSADSLRGARRGS